MTEENHPKFRHDRSVINAYGGVWPGVADRLRNMILGTVVALPSKQRAALIKSRRNSLGITQQQLGVAAGYKPSCSSTIVGTVERGTGYEKSVARLEAALDKLEASLTD